MSLALPMSEFLYGELYSFVCALTGKKTVPGGGSRKGWGRRSLLRSDVVRNVDTRAGGICFRKYM